MREGARAKELLRHGKAREQALEERAASDFAEPAGEVALGDAGRAQEEEVLAGDGGEDEEAGLECQAGARRGRQ